MNQLFPKCQRVCVRNIENNIDSAFKELKTVESSSDLT